MPLQIALWDDGFATVGTVRSNRLKGCALPKESDMKKKGRGSTIYNHTLCGEVDLNVVRWFDNKAVTLLSTYTAVEPVKKVRRFDKKKRGNGVHVHPSSVNTTSLWVGWTC